MPPEREDFGERLVRIETKVDALFEKLVEASEVREAQRVRLEHSIDDIENRVSEMERRLNILTGVLIAINFAAVFFADKIRSVFN
jgi:hypothetical protein